MGFRLTREAEEDVIDIAEQGVRLFGPVQAGRYHDELFAVFDLIVASPRMARERLEITPPVRIHPFKAHLVVYRIEQDGDILIIRVRHGHENWADENQGEMSMRRPTTLIREVTAGERFGMRVTMNVVSLRQPA